MAFQQPDYKVVDPNTGPLAALLSSLMQTRKIQGQGLANQEQGIRNQYLGPSLQAALSKAQTEASYAPDMAQAALLESQARPDLIRSQTQQALAHAGLLKAQTDLAPQDSRTKYISALAKQTMADKYGSPNVILSRILRSPAFTELSSRDPRVAREIVDWMRSQTSSAIGAPTDKRAPLSNKDLTGFQNAMRNVGIKQQQTTQQINQRMYANTAEAIFDNLDQYLPNVSVYAGAKGQAKLIKDRASASLGANIPEYEDYQIFASQIQLGMNEIRRQIGGPTTDKETKLMQSIVNPITWKNNPETAIKQYKALRDLLKKRINRALGQAPSETEQKLANESQTENFDQDDPLGIL